MDKIRGATQVTEMIGYQLDPPPLQPLYDIFFLSWAITVCTIITYQIHIRTTLLRSSVYLHLGSNNEKHALNCGGMKLNNCT